MQVLVLRVTRVTMDLERLETQGNTIPPLQSPRNPQGLWSSQHGSGTGREGERGASGTRAARAPCQNGRCHKGEVNRSSGPHRSCLTGTK